VSDLLIPLSGFLFNNFYIRRYLAGIFLCNVRQDFYWDAKGLLLPFLKHKMDVAHFPPKPPLAAFRDDRCQVVYDHCKFFNAINEPMATSKI
jgi:hypothetical protein